MGLLSGLEIFVFSLEPKENSTKIHYGVFWLVDLGEFVEILLMEKTDCKKKWVSFFLEEP